MAFTGDQRSIQATYASVGELVPITRQGKRLQGSTQGDSVYGNEHLVSAPYFASETVIGTGTGTTKGNFGAAHVYVPQIGDEFDIGDKTFTISTVSPYRIAGVTLYYIIEAGYA